MNNYRITLYSKALLTQLPDSQKLFGALIYLLSETCGVDKATAFVQAVFKKDIHIALSNVLPAGYLPTPQEYLMDYCMKNKDNEVDLKAVRKRIKKRNYIKTEILAQVLRATSACVNTPCYVNLQDRQSIHASIESMHYNIVGLDSTLYSVPYTVPREINESNDDKKSVINFNFYLQISDCSSEAFLEMLQCSVQQKKRLILGKRASQGWNTFQLSAMTALPRWSNQENGLYLNTGMMLPDQIDFEASTLKLFTSERRPFEMFGGGLQRNMQYISFLDAGSIVSAPAGIAAAVKSLQSPFDKKRSIVFGNAFLYPLNHMAEGDDHAENTI